MAAVEKAVAVANSGVQVTIDKSVDTVVAETVSENVGVESPGSISKSPMQDDARNVESGEAQFMHCHILLLNSQSEFHATLVYAANDMITRKGLWNDLITIKTSATDFCQVVKEIWQTDINGFAMFRVNSKLNLLKEPLKHLNRRDFDGIDLKEKKLRQDLIEVQNRLRVNPLDVQAQIDEKEAYAKYLGIP
ncbi:hypothetical protein RIF29_38813 [Crotalaria pallida]|uniref:Uncharacterized protein n=1 Tax=Crotalaria pallida TaxID=3830 RepID=A0AAN9E320_CROPI